MRFFAGEDFPKLSIFSEELPSPWIVPAYLSRAHRDRLVRMFGRALLAFDDRLSFVELSWAERDFLTWRKVRIPRDAVIWWRVEVPSWDDRALRTEEQLREIVEEGSKLHPGRAIYDFDGPLDLPGFGWLGAFKVQVLHRLIDEIEDRELLEDPRWAVESLHEAAGWLESAVDLLDFAEGMLEMRGFGYAEEACRDEAMARVLAARFGGKERGKADRELGVLVKVRAGESSLEGEERAALAAGGLLDRETGRYFPVMDALKREGVWQRFVKKVAGARGIERALRELLPGWVPEELPLGGLISIMRSPEEPRLDVALRGVKASLGEPENRMLKRATVLLLEGQWEEASRLVLKAIEREEDRLWTEKELQQGASILGATVQKMIGVQEDNLDPDWPNRVATTAEAAARLMERVGLTNDASFSLLIAGKHWRIGHSLLLARGALERALRLSEPLGEGVLWAIAYQELGALALEENRLEEARDAYQKALTLSQDLGYRRGETECLTGLGEVAGQMGQLDEAKGYYERVLSIAERCDNRHEVVRVSLHLATLALHMDELEAAQSHFEKALSIAKAVGNRKMEANIYSALLSVAVVKGSYEDADQAYQQAREIYREMNDRSGAAELLAMEGLLSLAKDEAAKAKASFEQARLIYKEIGDTQGVARVEALLEAGFPNPNPPEAP